MKKRVGMAKGILAGLVVWTLLATAVPVMAQGDLVPVSDVTGGSSVFVFRGGQRTAPKRNYTKSRATRTKSQRLETAKKVRKQYTTLAKTAPRRERSTVVAPDDPRLPKIPTMPKEQAARIFAGVGEYYMDRDEYDEAIRFFRESVALDDTYVSARSGLSEALALKGNDELVKGDNAKIALTFFTEALEKNPKNAPAYFGMAEAYSELGEELKAVANYQQALSSDKDLTEIYVPLGILYYQQGEIAKSDELLSKALASGAADDAQTQYFIGLIRFSQNKNAEALDAFNKAKTLDPTNAEAFYQAGETLARLDRNADAVAEYKQATTLRPNYFEAWFSMGSTLYEMEKYPEAIEAYKQAVRYRNDNIEAYINLGEAYRQTNKFNEAESNYNLATTFISRKPDYPKDDAADIYSKIGFVIAKQCELNIRVAKPCKWDAAVTALEKAAQLSQNSVDAQNLGWAYYNAARTDLNAKNPTAAKPKLEKAKLYLLQAASANPKFIEGPLMNLGMVLTDMGDYDGAIEALQKVVNKEPKWVFALNELGIAYRKKENFKEAANMFRKAISKDGKFAVAHYNLGEAEYRSGNLGEAKKAYQNLKKLGRNDLAVQLELISGGAVRGATE